MRKNLLSGILAAVALGVSAYGVAADGSMELLLAGPVESIDLGAHSVTVLGQRFTTNDGANLSLGELVNVYGVLQSDGTIADAVVEQKSQQNSQYVAGADPVFVKGVVKSTDGDVGHLRVGNSLIDYTDLLSSNDFSVPSAGDVVELSGIQPAANGVVLASAVGVGSAPAPAAGNFKVAISSGSGLNRAISSGSGFNRSISSGSGFNRSISSGSGFNRSISSGSGFNRSISSGSGLNRSISSGSGFNRSISSGSGFNRSISSGSGFNRSISSGSGFNRAISSGSGLQRR